MRENHIVSENLYLSKFQAFILKDNKGCRAIREEFQNKNTVPWWEEKWNSSIMENIDQREWAIYYDKKTTKPKQV